MNTPDSLLYSLVFFFLVFWSDLVSCLFFFGQGLLSFNGSCADLNWAYEQAHLF